MKIIYSTNGSAAIGPYSHGIQSGNLFFLSGQTPIDPLTMKIESDDIEGQTLRALKNIECILGDAGLALSNIVKANVYITDMALFQKMNAVYEQVFKNHKPARTTVSVSGLPLNALVEIECIAEINANI